MPWEILKNSHGSRYCNIHFIGHGLELNPLVSPRSARYLPSQIVSSVSLGPCLVFVSLRGAVICKEQVLVKTFQMLINRIQNKLSFYNHLMACPFAWKGYGLGLSPLSVSRGYQLNLEFFSERKKITVTSAENFRRATGAADFV